MKINEVTNRLDASHGNIELALQFVKKMWSRRAMELGRPDPKNLKNSCKFVSMFLQNLFGGQIQGNGDHQYVVLGDGRILDFDPTEETNQYHDPNFWGDNQDHKESMKSCEPRVNQWVSKFRAEYPQLF